MTLKAIESGKIGFWVLPEGAGVTIANPNPTGTPQETPTTTTTQPPAANENSAVTTAPPDADGSG